MFKLILVMIFNRVLIYPLKRFTQPIRDDGPKSHLQKRHVPTFGGLIILGLTLLQYLIHGIGCHTVTQVMSGFGLLGLYDDLKKVYFKSSKGISAKGKFLLQWILGLGIAYQLNISSVVDLFGYGVDLSFGYPLFASFVMVAYSNAYNLTDGIDGLASSQAFILLLFLGAVAIGQGRSDILEMILILSASILGFFSVNCHPARIFMGDVGSLAIGALLGYFSIILKVEMWFAVASLLLIAETLSVILQVWVYKRKRIRLFKMAPFHHHLELSGWSEWRITLMLGLWTSLCMMLSGMNYAI